MKKGLGTTGLDRIQVDFSNDRHFQVRIENSTDVNRYAKALRGLANLIETDPVLNPEH